MYFITTFPDDFYFTWQLEIQLLNFNQLGIPSQNIHVLIAYNAKVGLRHYFSDLIARQNDKALFFAYPDVEEKRAYTPSVRPFLIYTHLALHPFLMKEMLFYYDTDIIFRKLPDFDQFSGDDYCYVSDTRNYMDSNYIKKSGSSDLLEDMCKIVGVSPQVIEKNDPYVGGAQLVLKNTTCEFWRKVETDCNLLFALMNQYNHLEEDKAWLAERKRRSQCHGIQAWTAEMWAILWNIWLSGSETRIHDALDFCWTTQDISNWESKNILHYSGVVKEGDARHFRKADYLRYTPYYSNKLKAISPSSCSYPLGQLIGIFKADLDKHRYDLSNVTVVLALPEYIEEVFENLEIIIRYIDKSFYTNLILRHSAAFSEGQFELLDKLIQKNII